MSAARAAAAGELADSGAARRHRRRCRYADRGAAWPRSPPRRATSSKRWTPPRSSATGHRRDDSARHCGRSSSRRATTTSSCPPSGSPCARPTAHFPGTRDGRIAARPTRPHSHRVAPLGRGRARGRRRGTGRAGRRASARTRLRRRVPRAAAAEAVALPGGVRLLRGGVRDPRRDRPRRTRAPVICRVPWPCWSATGGGRCAGFERRAEARERLERALTVLPGERRGVQHGAHAHRPRRNPPGRRGVRGRRCRSSTRRSPRSLRRRPSYHLAYLRTLRERCVAVRPE